jgi:hypothetical protein
MKKTIVMTMFIALVTVIAGSCAKAAPQTAEPTLPSIEAMINPGDKIGDFLITTGDDKNITYVSTIHCPFDQNTSTESCEIPVGTKVNVGIGFYDDDPSSGKTLDETWLEQINNHEMLIEGRPVNLQAFGSIDIPHPMVGTIRNWNVVIVTDKPGKITARSTGVYDGDPFDYTAILTFIAP